MSDQPQVTTTQIQVSDMPWARPSISIIGLAIFGIGYAIAFFTHDASALLLFAGAAISFGQQVIGYWIGSSSSSARKDATIAAAATAQVQQPAPFPPPTSTVTTTQMVTPEVKP